MEELFDFLRALLVYKNCSFTPCASGKMDAGEFLQVSITSLSTTGSLLLGWDHYYYKCSPMQPGKSYYSRPVHGFSRSIWHLVFPYLPSPHSARQGDQTAGFGERGSVEMPPWACPDLWECMTKEGDVIIKSAGVVPCSAFRPSPQDYIFRVLWHLED